MPGPLRKRSKRVVPKPKKRAGRFSPRNRVLVLSILIGSACLALDLIKNKIDLLQSDQRAFEVILWKEEAPTEALEEEAEVVTAKVPALPAEAFPAEAVDNKELPGDVSGGGEGGEREVQHELLEVDTAESLVGGGGGFGAAGQELQTSGVTGASRDAGKTNTASQDAVAGGAAGVGIRVATQDVLAGAVSDAAGASGQNRSSGRAAKAGADAAGGAAGQDKPAGQAAKAGADAAGGAAGQDKPAGQASNAGAGATGMASQGLEAGKAAGAGGGVAGVATGATGFTAGTGAGVSGEATPFAAKGKVTKVLPRPPNKPGPAVTAEVCTDTCATARDGVCDEGRPLLPIVPEGQRDPDIYPVTCDLGTDCADCGPWAYTGSKEALKWRPIQEIQAKGFAVSVRQTATPPAFWIAFTDPAHDEGVSRSLHKDGLIDQEATVLWHRILKQGCVGQYGSRRLALDVGANFGYFTLLAASIGCRVIAWEPVPFFAAFLQYGLLRNAVTDRVELRHRAVGDEHGVPLIMVVPQRGSWETAGVNGVTIDKWVDNEGDYDQLLVASERVDKVVKEDVLLMKVQAGGFEPWALKSANQLMLGHKVENIYLDYKVWVWERLHHWAMAEHFPAALGRLATAEYKIYHIPEGSLPHVFGADLQPLDYVSKGNLKHDIEDIYRLQNGTLGCPLPPQLKGLWECNQIPEALHPQSFRSAFEQVTRLWAMHPHALATNFSRTGQSAGLFPLHSNPNEFFTLRKWGAGRRLCNKLEPARRVAHRCRCHDHRVCAEQETLASYFQRSGKLPPLPPPKEADVDHLFVGNW